MTTIIDGKKIRDEILAEVKQGVSTLPFVPVFCDVMVGDDPVSLQYVRMKAKTAMNVGIQWRDAAFPETITTDALIAEIEKLNTVPYMCGLIIQLPLPPHIDKQAVLDAIDPTIDVDCLGGKSSESFYSTGAILGFPTAFACLAVLDSLALDLSDKRIAVLGQGQLVGKPVTHLLRSRGLAVDAISSDTEQREQLLKDADVVISAIGEPNFIKGAMIKQGAIIIDAGTSEATDAIAGDVDRASVEGVASFLSPVPGGVGPVTVAMLLQNVLTAAQQK